MCGRFMPWGLGCNANALWWWTMELISVISSNFYRCLCDRFHFQGEFWEAVIGSLGEAQCSHDTWDRAFILDGSRTQVIEKLYHTAP